MPADYIRCQQNTCEVTIGMNDEGTEAASLYILSQAMAPRERRTTLLRAYTYQKFGEAKAVSSL